MPITCKICNKEFQKLITSTHLATHQMKTTCYVVKYGKDSLASAEYRAEKSNKNSGINNPNYGNKMTEESKKSISNKNSGNTAWNKNKKLEDTSAYKKAAINREEKYRTGILTRYTPNHTEETKEKISKGVSLYAESHKNELMNRAQLAIKTKIDTGYYDRKRNETIYNFRCKCNVLGFDLINQEDDIVTISCNTCNNIHTRSIHSVVHGRMCPICSNIGVSSYEKDVISELKNILNTEYILSDKSILGNLELDIFMPAYKLAIEINGLYWHSEEAGKGKFYHLYKTNKCKEKGIQLIHIFEDEWLYKKEICIERIKSKLNLFKPKYARNFTIKELSNNEACDFLVKYHIQGQGTSASHCYGLVDTEDKLVAVMTFSKLSIAKGSSHIIGKYELNRYASIENVVGGASKLFSYFVKTINPIEIISYSDLRWNTGNLYEKIGFINIGATLPGYWYVKGTERIHRFKLRKTDLDPVDKTEKELRSAQGYLRIWDCGHSKWIWKNNNANHM